MSAYPVPVAAVVPSPEDMARRRYQRPNVLKKEVQRPYWFIRYRADVLTDQGVQYREMPPKMLGYCDEMSKKEAGRVRDEFLKTLNAGSMVLQSQVRLSQFLQTYRRLHVPTVKPNTQRSIEAVLRAHIEPKWGSKRLCDITTERLQEWVNELKAKVSPGHLRNIVTRLDHVFSEAERLDYHQQRNPVSRVKLPAYDPKRETISPGDYARLLACLPGDLRLMARFAAECGLRIGEIQGCRPPANLGGARKGAGRPAPENVGGLRGVPVEARPGCHPAPAHQSRSS